MSMTLTDKMTTRKQVGNTELSVQSANSTISKKDKARVAGDAFSKLCSSSQDVIFQ